MTATDIRTLVYQVYEAINTKNIEALEKLFDPHVIRHAAATKRHCHYEKGSPNTKRPLLLA